MMRFRYLSAFGMVIALQSALVQAEIVASSADHFRLQLEAHSALAPEDLWARLILPADWWHADHTYSGDAGNLSLDVRAGGLWLEQWKDNSVAHGTVLIAQPPGLLRLNAPFGPLQELAVTAVWTISIEPVEGGSTVRFDFVVNGTAGSDLHTVAPAVDFVKGQALKSLVSTVRE